MFSAKDIFILILFACFLFLNLYILKEVVTHYEAFEANPFIFGAEKNSVTSCTCISDKGSVFFFNKSSLWSAGKGGGIPQLDPSTINYSANVYKG